MMTRTEGWEARLVGVIEHARFEPYELGKHDCLRVACQAVEALTGEDLWPQFAGYTTRREALRAILQHGPDLAAAATAVLGSDPVSTLAARRGDIVQYTDVEDHLGVCIGASVAVLGPEGLVIVGLLDERVRRAWRIG